MPGLKRSGDGQPKIHEGSRQGPRPEIARNAYTGMFKQFRNELDEQHERRERIVKASRDITALSKKIVRRIENDLPGGIRKEIESRLAEVSRLLAAMAPDVQGLDRYRFQKSLFCLEELVEALSFAHYLQSQRLISMDELVIAVQDLARRGAVAIASETKGAVAGDVVGGTGASAEPLVVSLTVDDYLFGVFDLSGEMMRFATVVSALTGTLAAADKDEQSGPNEERTIVQDMQDLGSFYAMLPQRDDRVWEKTWEKKMQTLQQSVRKVERLGYDRTVRGSERPAGWVPDLAGAKEAQMEGNTD